MEIEVKTTFDYAAGKIKLIADGLGDITDAMDAATEAFREAKDNNFESQSFNGMPWKAYSATTIAIKEQNKQPKPWSLLYVTGNLRTRWQTTKTAKNAIFFGTNVPYAGDHQYGIPEKRLPARPFLPIAKENFEDYKKDLEEFLQSDGIPVKFL